MFGFTWSLLIRRRRILSGSLVALLVFVSSCASAQAGGQEHILQPIAYRTVKVGRVPSLLRGRARRCCRHSLASRSGVVIRRRFKVCWQGLQEIPVIVADS